MARETPYKNQPGDVFNFWTVVRVASSSPRGKTRLLCRCVCGTERVVHQSGLRTGRSRSCGCKKIDLFLEHHSTHGHARNGIKSGTYSSWHAMKTRCNYPKHKRFYDYGGRGIKVCERWLHSFDNFLSDMGERPEGQTLDRKDANGDYTPSNCKWATSHEQAFNKRSNVRYTIDGISKTVPEWCQIYGVPLSRVKTRLCIAGLNIKQALTVPPRTYVKKPNPIPE